MTLYLRRLRELSPDPAGRRWLLVPYDQLSDRIGPLSREDPSTLGILLVDSRWKAARRPYHKQKLALVMTSVRHFALEQAARGVAVWHASADGLYRDAISPLVGRFGPIRMMRAAERELREDLRPLIESGAIVELPHEGWLTTAADFAASQSGPPYRMDAFYRHVRREYGLLMDPRGKPLGGRFSFDGENRRPWKGSPPPATPPHFDPDEITLEVCRQVERDYAHHPGRLDAAALPATLSDAQQHWRWALGECLPDFGPYEDAMSIASTTLFHSRISALLNLHRLLPRDVLADVVRLLQGEQAPLASVEGFVRQVLGWREFVRHVHEATDGFRALPPAAGDKRPQAPSPATSPGDGGFSRWTGRAWSRRVADQEPDGGAASSALRASRPLPVAYWNASSGLNCLDTVVRSVWDEAYSHHITRLMVLGNIATLLDVAPRELTDWFWVAYSDAYDWVVEPNVLGMGTWGVGELMMTKPYVSGAAYIDRMSDYCGGCAFDPGQNCPITRLYWAFLARHEAALAGNQRMAMPYRSLAKRPPAEREADRLTFESVCERLDAGHTLTPANFSDRAADPVRQPGRRGGSSNAHA